MEKNLLIGNLLSIYGATLDEKARNILVCYYDYDMSLAEIAEDTGLSRQGVRDVIVRNSAHLSALEEALSLKERIAAIDALTKQALELAEDEELRNIIAKIGEQLVR